MAPEVAGEGIADGVRTLSGGGREEMLDRIARAAVSLLGAKLACVWVADPRDQVLRAQGGYAADERLGSALAAFTSVPCADGVVGRIFESRALDCVADIQDDRRRLGERPARDAGLRGHAAIPLVAGDRPVGVLSIFFSEPRQFAADDEEILHLLAAHATLAIENDRLLAETGRCERTADETRRQQQEAVALEEVAREIISSLEQGEVFQRIVARARELCGSDLAFLAPHDPKAGAATIVAVSGTGREALTALKVRPGQGAGGWVLQTGEPFVTDDYINDARLPKEQAEVPARIGVRTLAVVPVRFRGSITGLLWVANRIPRGFTGSDLRVLTKLADQAAIALENSRLYAEAQELAVSRERVRVATELHDTLSQMLFSVALGLDWCLHRLPGAPELRSKMQEIKRDTGLVMRQLRELIGHLAPDGSREVEYPDQLHRLVGQFRELTGIPVDLIEHGDPARLASHQQEVLYKTFQEALANVAKHARATRATIRVDVRPDEVCFEVADDGIGPPTGADLARLDQAPGHFGLRQMLERIDAHGGTVGLGLAHPSGFRLWGTLPIR